MTSRAQTRRADRRATGPRPPLDVLGSEVEIRHVDGADRSALLPALKDADAVLIRSATKIDAEALAPRHS